MEQMEGKFAVLELIEAKVMKMGAQAASWIATGKTTHRESRSGGRYVDMSDSGEHEARLTK